MNAWRQGAAIARLTALETVRRPICLLLAGSCVLLTGLAPLVLLHQFGEPGKLARDAGLALHLVGGLFLAAYAAAATVSGDVRGGTGSAVLGKPVGRGVFVLAKFAGLAAIVLAFSLALTGATLLAERVAERFTATAQAVGYVTDWRTGWMLAAVPFAACLAGGLWTLRRRPFGTAAGATLLAGLALVLVTAGCFDRLGQWAPYAPRLDWRLLPAGALIGLALLALTALAVALAVRLGPAPVMTLCTFFFLAGLMSDACLGRNAAPSAPAAVLYRLLPNWRHFWMADALMSGGRIPWSYVGAASLYAGLCTAAFLALAVLGFRNMELK
ncbi:MAG: hypothetical protein JW951_06060 [Lentisphaerae bacterium]|nr:hypothetical protein [Lentisphaerota bacterium]